jgi:hypothetical protein
VTKRRLVRTLAWLMLAFVLVAWPLAHLVFAKGEPQFVLAVSMLALLYESINALMISDEEV